MGTTGAYTFSMASNYNRFPKPAVVFAGGATHRLVVRRETEAELVRNDVDDEAAPAAPSPDATAVRGTR